MDCLFCSIASGKIKSKTAFENDKLMAFHDIHPQAPVHILLIPREHIPTLNDLTPEQASLMGELVFSAKQLAHQLSLATNGYRLVWNCNRDAGQTVFHVHLHLLGGRALEWPPG